MPDIPSRDAHRRSPRVLLLAGVAIAAWYVATLVRGTPPLVPDAIFIATPALGTVACIAAGRRLGRRGLSWWLIGAGCASWLAGSVAWIAYDVVLTRPVPYPSVADIGYLLFYPFVFAGLLVLIRGANDGPPTIEILLDSVIIAIVTGSLVVELMLLPVTSRMSTGFWEFVTSVAWQAGTFGMVFLTALAVARRSDLLDRRFPNVLMAGLLCFSIGSVVYARIALEGTYTPGDPIDLTWHIGFILIALAAIDTERPARPAARDGDVVRTRVIVASRGGVTMLGALVLTAHAAWVASTEQPSTAAVVVSLIVGLSLAVRLGYAAVQGDRLTRRTRERDRLAAVVAASTAIAATAPAAEMLVRLAEATALGVGRARAEMYVYDRERTAVEASAFYGFPPEELAAMEPIATYEIGFFPAERHVIDTRLPAVQDLLRTELPHEIIREFREVGKDLALVIPLLAHGDVVGVVACWTPNDSTRFDPADVAAGAAIGKQAGLAINNARLLADARAQAGEQAALLRVSQASVSSSDLREVLMEIARASLGVAGAECCGIDLWYPEAGEMEVVSEETIPDWPDVVTPGTRYSIRSLPMLRRIVELHEPLILSGAQIHDDDVLSGLFSSETQSFLGYPLVTGSECLGVLNMYARLPNTFRDADLPLAREIAVKASLGIQSARLLARTRRQAEEQATLLRVSQAVVSGQDLNTILSEVAQASVGLGGAEGCEIEVYDRESGTAERVASRYVDNWSIQRIYEDGERYSLTDWSIAKRVLEDHQPRIATVDDPDLSQLERDAFLLAEVHNVLVTPLVIGSEPLGLLSLYSRRGRRFSAETMRFAMDLAAQAAQAIDRGRLNAALRRRADTDGLTGVLNHRAILETLDRILDRARRRGERFSVLLIDLDNFKLFNDTHGHLVGDQVLRRATEILLECVRGGDHVGRYGGDEFLVILDGAGTDEARVVANRLLDEIEASSIAISDLNLPLRISIGISIYPDLASTRQELIALADAAMYAAKDAGGGQARVTGREAEPREQTTLGALMGLVRAVDRKDRYTRVHSDLVTDAAVRFGRFLELDEDQLEALAIAGQLHDVGKIAVPDSILRKPGRLTASETDILRQHVVFSELIVKGVPHLHDVSAAIANHHERWDGGGYPRGVAGVDIPLLGRIMALADAWSAMIHDRPYRKRLDQDAAVGELRAGSGTQFDPELIEAFIATVTSHRDNGQPDSVPQTPELLLLDELRRVAD